MTPARGGRIKKEPPGNSINYWKKALRFAQAAHANHEGALWDPAIANATNALVNVVDALCIHYLGFRSASESHGDALNHFARVAEIDPDVRRRIAQHLERLLAVKNIAQYEGSRPLEEPDSNAALSHMERALEMSRPIARRLRWF